MKEGLPAAKPPQVSDIDTPTPSETRPQTEAEALAEAEALEWQAEFAAAEMDVVEAKAEAEALAEVEAQERQGEEAAFRADMGLPPWSEPAPVATPSWSVLRTQVACRRVRPHARRRRQTTGRRARGSPSSDPADPAPPWGWQQLDLTRSAA